MSEGERFESLARVRSLVEAGGRLYGRSLELLEETDSTNDDARRAAEAGAPRGHVVVADAQRRGRGARGSGWSSPKGTDLYVSILERPERWPSADPSIFGMLTLAVGLGVRDACEGVLAARGIDASGRLRVKWPNDVQLDEQKCAGVLVESSSIGERIGPVVVGVGLDVNRLAWPPELEGLATSLRAGCVDQAPLDRALVLAALLGSVEARVERLLAGDRASIVRELGQRLAWVGERVRLDDREGILEGLDEEGALLLRTSPARLEALRAGRLRRA